jgi:cob(I)alamin adenosyltransferase
MRETHPVSHQMGQHMVKIDKVYTRTGDDGRTGLGDGSRLPKFHLRVAAYGALDEANSLIGLAIVKADKPVAAILTRVQNDLFDLGADLCRPDRESQKVEPLRVLDSQVRWLEETIDSCTATLSPLTSFILPGGSESSALLHIARTSARRAEREIVELAFQDTVNPAVIRYVNRLSDLLFVLARVENGNGRDDVLWRPGGDRAS